MCVYEVVLINILVLQLGPPKQKFLAPPLTIYIHTWAKFAKQYNSKNILGGWHVVKVIW